MQFASALSRDLQTEAAVTEVLEAVTQRLPDQHAHVSFVFASPHHLKALPSFLPVVQERLSSHALLDVPVVGSLATAMRWKIVLAWR